MNKLKLAFRICVLSLLSLLISICTSVDACDIIVVILCVFLVSMGATLYYVAREILIINN